jgi:hypothetical protein
MRPVLEALFDLCDAESARATVLSDEGRAELRRKINMAAQSAGSGGIVPDGQYADNLLQGLLALRMKFDRAEAAQKLELNLAMRAQRRD